MPIPELVALRAQKLARIRIGTFAHRTLAHAGNTEIGEFNAVINYCGIYTAQKCVYVCSDMAAKKCLKE
eukprot:1356961-Amorphochlora_amoeboformis.AAC.2